MDAIIFLKLRSSTKKGNAGLYYLLHSTKSVLAQLNCVITHIPREGNSNVDDLARVGARLPIFTLFHEHEFPLNVKVMI